MNLFDPTAYLYIKAIHIVAVVSWFAGLFYLVRLFIYHTEAQEKIEIEKKILSEQFSIMERRLWKAICQPAMIMTFVTGLWLVIFLNAWKFEDYNYWMYLKSLFLLGLMVYHFHLNKIRNSIEIKKYSSKFLRIYNEVATFYLFFIVFSVVIKSIQEIMYSIFGTILFMFIITMLFRKKLSGK